MNKYQIPPKYSEKPLIELKKAAKLAQWLIEMQKKKAVPSYCIAARKYKIEHWSMVRKEYQKLKPVQLALNLYR